MAGEEDLEAVDEDEERCPEETPDGKAGLEDVVVDELLTIDTLGTMTLPYETKRAV